MAVAAEEGGGDGMMGGYVRGFVGEGDIDVDVVRRRHRHRHHRPKREIEMVFFFADGVWE